MSLTKLTTCGNAFEANAIKSLLDDAGIGCFILNENTGSLFPLNNDIGGLGVQVLVEESDFETAYKLIDEAANFENTESEFE